jgi:hypothetical protein
MTEKVCLVRKESIKNDVKVSYPSDFAYLCTAFKLKS